MNLTKFYHNGRLIGDKDETMEYLFDKGLAVDFATEYLMNHIPPESLCYGLATGEFSDYTTARFVREALDVIEDYEGDITFLGISSATMFPGYYDRKPTPFSKWMAKFKTKKVRR